MIGPCMSILFWLASMQVHFNNKYTLPVYNGSKFFLLLIKIIIIKKKSILKGIQGMTPKCMSRGNGNCGSFVDGSRLTCQLSFWRIARRPVTFDLSTL